MAEVIGKILQMVVSKRQNVNNLTVPPPSLHSILNVRLLQLSLWEENRFDSLFTVFTYSQPLI